MWRFALPSVLVAKNFIAVEMSGNASSDEENFEDALGDIPCPMEMDLQTSINETITALDLFLNNKFSDALQRMKPRANSSMYHALGYGTILYIQAIMTYEMEDIEAAIDSLKKAAHVCKKFQKNNSVTASLKKMISSADYSEYTEEQIHAELCYAECLLQRAVLTFIQDESVVNFFKGGIKIRTCYKSYKECLNILNKRSWNNQCLKIHFESGVKMGVGAFNLVLGLKELDEGFSLSESLRSPLCSTVLLTYHTGAMFLYFSGRVEEIKGDIDKAITRFEESVSVQKEWVQFHHICYWELMWCHCYNGNWTKAAEFAEHLLQGSRWSKAMYTYQKASFLCMQANYKKDIEEIKSLLSQVPGLKQRIAGKSLPIEKFAAKKSQRFFAQDNMLILPALELLYVWNGFTILGQQKTLITSMFAEVEKAEILLKNEQDKFHTENLCLVLFLKGMCYRYLDSPLLAEECFSKIYKMENALHEDIYLVPFSLLELGLLSINAGEFKTAEILFDKAMNYEKFGLDGRLHFRVHSAKNKIKQNGQHLSVQTSNPLPTPNPSPTAPRTSLL
ncbi:Tetratricopeptide repeat protein 39B [Nymphon striatum]|nr:Tetratricopeptide repeat protein 39B [Nymphon striatum]